MKFISWNVNGLRACLKKGFEDVFNALDADFFCIQETKMQPAARQERFGTKFNTAVNGFYKSLDDTFKSFTLTAENGLDQIRAQSIGGSTAKGE